MLRRFELVTHYPVLDTGLGQGFGLQDQEEGNQRDQYGNDDWKSEQHAFWIFKAYYYPDTCDQIGNII